MNIQRGIVYQMLNAIKYYFFFRVLSETIALEQNANVRDIS